LAIVTPLFSTLHVANSLMHYLLHTNKMKIMKKILVFFLTIIIIVFSLYTLRDIQKQRIGKIMKSDIFGENRSCAFPCWNQITPAETTIEETISIVQRLHYVKRNSIKSAGTEVWGGMSWDWKISGDKTPTGIAWENGIITEIDLGLPFQLTVNELIKNYGNPESIHISDGGLPERWFCLIILFYASEGFQATVYTEDFSTQFLPSDKVVAITLFPPTTNETRIMDFYSESDPEILSQLNQPWNGFGDIKEIYDTTFFR